MDETSPIPPAGHSGQPGSAGSGCTAGSGSVGPAESFGTAGANGASGGGAGPAGAPAPQPVVVRVEQPRQPRGLMITLIVLLCITIATLGSCAFVGGSAVKGLLDIAGASFDEEDALSAYAMDSVAVYHMDGAIGSGGISAEEVRSVLRNAEDDPSVKALVVRVDSPGGEAAAATEIASYIDGFSKPIVFSVGSMCASAAYLAASQSDWIVSTDMSEVGSIGTIIESYNIEGLLDKLGVEAQTIKSSSMKDMGSASRAMTDEEKALLQEKVDRATNAFIEKVADGRGEDVETVRSWATGATFFGTEALDKGLVDQIGTYDDALDKAAELGGLDGTSYAIVSVDPDNGLLDDLGLGSLLGF